MDTSIVTYNKNTQYLDSKELKRMKLDSDLFWGSYEAKFEEQFEPVLEELKLKYKEGDESQTKNQKKRYDKVSRYKRLVSKRKFGKLSRIVRSYSIKKRTNNDLPYTCCH